MAKEITIYYSPTCPHCHHAIAYVNDVLKKEDSSIKIKEIDASKPANSKKFMEMLKKCGFKEGYVPVTVIGEECFQGFDEITEAKCRKALGLSEKQMQDIMQAQNVKSVSSTTYGSRPLYALLAILLIALGFVLLRKKK
jgi:glutaredoxin